MINNLQRAMVLERLTIEAKHSMAGFPQVCFVRNTVRNPNIIVGEYTYYDDPENAEDFERNVLYHFPFIGDRLVIGKFCAIARLEAIARRVGYEDVAFFRRLFKRRTGGTPARYRQRFGTTGRVSGVGK